VRVDETPKIVLLLAERLLCAKPGFPQASHPNVPGASSLEMESYLQSSVFLSDKSRPYGTRSQTVVIACPRTQVLYYCHREVSRGGVLHPFTTIALSLQD